MNSKSSIRPIVFSLLALPCLLSCGRPGQLKTISKAVTVDGYDADITLKVSRRWEAVSMKIGTAETGPGKPERIVIDADPGQAFVDIDLKLRPRPDRTPDASAFLSEQLVLIDSKGVEYHPRSSVGPGSRENNGIEVGSMFEVSDTAELTKLEFGSLKIQLGLSISETLSN